MHTITIRMGAAHWDITFPTADGSLTTIDIRRLDPKGRWSVFDALRHAAQARYGKSNTRSN
jgi:hypothetical protein